ncbi:MAG: hypothetical protein LBE12_13560 [Planctomycetaceae bacterium]|jgi:hypothetical protein|nr:hypothetical protein [Planctomycetaceae bacterium]
MVSKKEAQARIKINHLLEHEIATHEGFKEFTVKDKNRIVPKFVAIVSPILPENMGNIVNGGTFKIRSTLAVV